MKKGIIYSRIVIQTEIECSILQVTFSKDVVKSFYAVYRPETFRLTKIVKQFEVPLHFFKSLKDETINFGDFNIAELKEQKDKREYTNFLAAHVFEVCKFSPTRVTRT